MEWLKEFSCAQGKNEKQHREEARQWEDSRVVKISQAVINMNIMVLVDKNMEQVFSSERK